LSSKSEFPLFFSSQDIINGFENTDTTVEKDNNVSTLANRGGIVLAMSRNSATVCQRRENGMIMANNPDAPKGSMQWMGCKAQFDTGFSVIVTDIRERRFIADPVTGLSYGFGYFDHDGSVAKMSTTLDGKLTDVTGTFRQPFSFIIAEIFKIKDGKIRQIEAVLMAVPYGMESGW
jgi:hypothetical protein